MANLYSLPDLPYGYGDLAPYLSEEQLKIHHTKHHQGYVNGANKIFKMLDQVRKSGSEYNVKSILKELSFNMGGHELHSFFWTNMCAVGKNGEAGNFGKELEEQFGSLDRFKDEFSKTAASVEGSGWAVLALDQMTKRLVLMQIEKHNVNITPNLPLLMVVDVWEHAYYLDYKNERGKFLDAFWNVVNWAEINKRFEAMT